MLLVAGMSAPLGLASTDWIFRDVCALHRYVIYTGIAYRAERLEWIKRGAMHGAASYRARMARKRHYEAAAVAMPLVMP